MFFFKKKPSKEAILINDLSNHVAELYQWIGWFLVLAHPEPDSKFKVTYPTETEFMSIMDECIELLDRADPYYIDSK